MTATATQDQRLGALQIANRRRLAQAHIRSEIKALDPPQGQALVADIIVSQHDGDLQAMNVLTLLMCVRGMRQKIALWMLEQAGLVRSLTTARLRDLTARQRVVLARAVVDYRMRRRAA